MTKSRNKLSAAEAVMLMAILAPHMLSKRRPSNWSIHTYIHTTGLYLSKFICHTPKSNTISSPPLLLCPRRHNNKPILLQGCSSSSINHTPAIYTENSRLPTNVMQSVHLQNVRCRQTDNQRLRCMTGACVSWGGPTYE